MCSNWCADRIPGGQNPSRTKSPRFGQLGQNPRDFYGQVDKIPAILIYQNNNVLTVNLKNKTSKASILNNALFMA